MMYERYNFKHVPCIGAKAPRKYFVNDVSEGDPCLMLIIQTPTKKEAGHFVGRKKVFRSLNLSHSSDFKA